MNILAVGTAEVESLKSALAMTKKVAADRVAKALEEEQTTHRKHEVRVGEVENELKDTIARCVSLEGRCSEQASELTKALENLKEDRVDAEGAC